jgi:hypothetical protein
METKKKTALKELKENILNSQFLSITSKVVIIPYIDELLQKEKEDLIEAFEVGYGSGISELGTNYFTETFEQ